MTGTSRQERERRFQIAHLLAEANLPHVAADIGVSVRTIERWVIRGVTWDQADLIAAKFCNDNPEHLFGPEWAAIADAVTGVGQDSLFDDDYSDLVRVEP